MNPERVTFAAEAIYFGGTLVQMPYTFSDSTLKAWAEDSTAPGGFRPLTIAFDGATASCELPLGSQGVWQVNMPLPFDPGPRFYPIVDATRQWHVGIGVSAGMHAPAPAPGNAAFDVNLALDQPYIAGDVFELFAAGPWAKYPFPTPPAPGAVTFHPPQVGYGQLAGVVRPTFPTITADDRVYVNRYRGPQLIGTFRVSPFSLGPGVNTISGTQGSFALNKTITAIASAQSATNRLARFNDTGAMNQNTWQINAVTDSIFNYSIGPQLTSGTVDLASGAISAAFGNPFDPDLKPVMNWIVQQNRPEYDDSSANPVTWQHYSGLNTYDREPTTGKVYSDDQGLPLSLSLNGIPLTTDKQVVGLANGQPMEFSLTADRMDGELRHIDCYRFDQNPQRYTYVMTTRVITDRVKLPGNALARGVRHMCRPHLYKGVPKAAEGDDFVRDPVMRLGFHDSASFIIP